MIVSVRGTPGAGKTTLIEALMASAREQVIFVQKKRVLGHYLYFGRTQLGEPGGVLVVGPYDEKILKKGVDDLVFCSRGTGKLRMSEVYDLVRMGDDEGARVVYECSAGRDGGTKNLMRLREEGRDVRVLLLSTSVAECWRGVRSRSWKLPRQFVEDMDARTARAHKKFYQVGIETASLTRDQALKGLKNMLRV